MNRADLQALSDIRLREANALLTAGHYDGAYYLAGYAVECALKACIARQTVEYDFPPKPDFVHRVYTHKLLPLIEAAGLTAQLKVEERSNRQFSINWGVVQRWTEDSRYERSPESDARALVIAVADPTNGVLPWVQRHW